MINCKKCKGRVFVDRVYSQNLRIELFCILCGKRWMIRKDTRFGTWLAKREEMTQLSYGISI
jgi:predicted deacetylase